MIEGGLAAHTFLNLLIIRLHYRAFLKGKLCKISSNFICMLVYQNLILWIIKHRQSCILIDFYLFVYFLMFNVFNLFVCIFILFILGVGWVNGLYFIIDNIIMSNKQIICSPWGLKKSCLSKHTVQEYWTHGSLTFNVSVLMNKYNIRFPIKGIFPQYIHL